MARNPNRMQEAVEQLRSNHKAFASNLISYSRGATTLTGISATVGRTPFQVDEGGVLVAYESRHYEIDAVDLAAFDVPKSGDVITDADGSRYTVSVPKPWNLYESIGPLGSVLKIHTVG